MKELTEKYLKTVLSWIERHQDVYEKFGYDKPKYEFKNGKGYIDENDLWQYHVVREYVKENTIHPHTYNGIPFNPMRNVKTTHYGYGNQKEL